MTFEERVVQEREKQKCDYYPSCDFCQNRLRAFESAVALFKPEIERLESGLAQSRELVAIHKAHIAELEAKLDERHVGELAAPGEC